MSSKSPATELKVTMVQTELVWQQANANCEQISKRLENLQDTDLIVLPEMFNSGFTLDATKVAETMDGETVQWMIAEAKKQNAAITGSIVVSEKGEHFNRMLFAMPDGTVEYYDKRHLFRMANEQQRYAAGETRKTITWRGWRIALYVCYDLRFPIWCRDQNDTDLMLFVASWPAVRSYPWQTLLKARAMENLCYVCGVNRIGTDDNNIDYSGDSAVIDMKGQETSYLGNDDRIETTALDGQALAKFRDKFPAWMDSDQFQIST